MKVQERESIEGEYRGRVSRQSANNLLQPDLVTSYTEQLDKQKIFFSKVFLFVISTFLIFLFRLVSFRFVLFCFVLFCFVLFCFVLCCFFYIIFFAHFIVDSGEHSESEFYIHQIWNSNPAKSPQRQYILHQRSENHSTTPSVS